MKIFVPERFSVIRVLRDDGTSKTFGATDHVLERSDVLVKIVRKGYFNHDRTHIVQQLSWFTGVRHSHLSVIFDAGITTKGDLYYVREYLPISELFSIDNLSAMRSLVSAVDFLRSNRRMHGAIKLSNIFLNNGCLKLTDPNFSDVGFRYCEEDIRFSAPEVLSGVRPNLESDLYSVGAVLYRVLAQRNLFEDLNLSHLKAKYTWASPVPIGNLCDVPKPVANLVMQLLDKDPQKRAAAFTSLKESIGAQPTPGKRAPFTGREALLKEVADFLLKQPTRGLRVLLMEGAPGIGKSRFIEELRIRCSFEGLMFFTSRCVLNAGEFHPVLQAMREIFRIIDTSRRGLDSDLTNFSNTVSECFRSDGETKRKYPVEKVTSDLAALLGWFARQTRLVLTIEDVDKADSATLRLIEQLSFRAVEVPLTLILTRRKSDPKLTAILSDCLGDNFVRRSLISLAPKESLELVQFFEGSLEQHPDLLQMAGGNPLFLEDYSTFRTPATTNSPRVSEALSWIMAQIPKEARPLTETLSLFRRPVELETIAKISNQNVDALQQQVEALGTLLERSGKTIRIAYSALAARIYRGISRRSRLDLAKRILEVLQTTACNREDLAYYSFEAGMFTEAGRLYEQLANTAHDRQDYQNAVLQYERLEECARQGEFEFAPREKLKLARSYQFTSKQTRALLICKGLLGEEAVHKDPELLSLVYQRLALSFDKTSARERVRLSRLAVECLSPESTQRWERLLMLCSNLIRTGDLSGAKETLQSASECAPSGGKTSHRVDIVRAALLINMADFRGATELLLRSDRNDDRAFVLSNLGFCFEKLGDLRKATEFYSRAQDFASTNGIIPLHILSLSNLGFVKTKLGEMSAAAKLFERALTWVEQLRKREAALHTEMLIGVYCDAALHSVQIGRYRRAAEYLKRIRSVASLSLELEQIYCGTVECLFYRAIGFTSKIRASLAKLNKLQIFRRPFSQVERTLIEVWMPDVSTEEKLRRLQEARETTYRLGTLYQQCQILNELAALHIAANEKGKALECTKDALRLAKRHGYKLLAARALLLAGVGSEKQNGKERKLFAAFQSASEMGLLELVAESAFHIGISHLESGNLVTAREYLVRSVSTTDSLKDEIPMRFRAKYLAMSWRRDARKGLERCNLTIQQQPAYAISNDTEAFGEDRYFKAAYRFALSGAAIKSAEALVTLIEETLRTSLARGAVVILKDSTGVVSRGVRIKPTEEVIQRVHAVAAMARNRIYFGSAEMARQKETVAWIPLQSETREGGIYVVCRQNEPPLTEKEMELLAIIGTIGNGALRGLETNHANELENTQLAEFHGMIGASKAIREVYSQVQIAAKNTATVLLEGESGTGKELVAKAIHAAGPRAKEPFIAVDCGAIPETLIEAELFGAKKGSYTGAVADRQGLFEAAHRGTIFLDEISNTTPALQTKLLRVIQEREVRRIGETRDRPIDVRLIAASNMNLETLLAEGRFRKDLLYRLNILHIKLPPLRGRRDDIPMLAHAFLQKLNAANKLKKYFAPGVLNHLANQNFPGNVRELQNAIERAFFLTKGSVISEVPVESDVKAVTDREEVESWFKDLSEGRKDFWSAVHNRYKHRDISREKVLALVDLGLRSTRGSYKILASKFNLKQRDYRRFMDFLRRNQCLLDFRPYRKASAETP